MEEKRVFFGFEVKAPWLEILADHIRLFGKCGFFSVKSLPPPAPSSKI